MEAYIAIGIAALIFALGVWMIFRPRKSSAGNLTPNETQSVVPPFGEEPEVPPSATKAAEPGSEPAGESMWWPTVEDQTESSPKSYEQLLADAAVACKRLDYDDAIDLFDEAVELAREKFGRDSIVVADILIKRGHAYQARDESEDEPETDAPDYPRALAIIAGKHGVYSVEVLPVLRKLIAFYDQTGRHHDADALAYRYARIVAARTSAENAATESSRPSPEEPAVATADHVDESTIQDAVSRGDGHALAFAYDEAIAAYEEALGTARELLGHSSEKCAQIMVKLGLAYQNRDDEDDDRGDDPAHYFRCALAYLEDKYGPAHPKLSDALTLLAIAYDEQGKHSASEGMLRRLEQLK